MAASGTTAPESAPVNWFSEPLLSHQKRARNGFPIDKDDYCWECHALAALDICLSCSAVYCHPCQEKIPWHNKYQCKVCGDAGCSTCYHEVFTKGGTNACIACHPTWMMMCKQEKAAVRRKGEDPEDGSFGERAGRKALRTASKTRKRR